MLCPECNIVMRMTTRQGVEIDYCPNCRGIWLDKGELDKLMERAVEERTGSSSYMATPQSPAAHHRRKRDYYDETPYEDHSHYNPSQRDKKRKKKQRYDDYDPDYDRERRRRRKKQKHWKRRSKDLIEDIFDIFD